MPTQIIAWILSFLSFFAFWNPNAQPNKIPETRTYEGKVLDKYGVWPTGEFETGKISPLVPTAFKTWYLLSELTKTKTESLLILHKGKLVYEEYRNGWDKDTPHYMASVTKSVVSALVGVAIGEGKINGVGDQVADYFPEAKTMPGWQESKADMTIEHLLTMTSGILAESEEDWNGFFAEDQKDAALFAFLLPQKTAPGAKYAYDNIAPSILLGIVQRATGCGDMLRYAHEKLFDPLGMTSVEWETTADGLPTGGFGINMTPRDMLRFGYLYLNNGLWEDKQIIPAGYVAVTPPRAKAKDAYGYMFWNYEPLPFDNSYKASGANGQEIVILPKWDIVIARTAEANWLSRGWADFEGKMGEWGLKFL